MKNLYVLLIGLLGLSVSGLAQSEKFPSIRGSVVTEDQQPRAHIPVRITPLNKVAVTNDQGVFSFYSLAPGTYTLTISLLGHAPLEQSVTVEAGQTAKPVFSLQTTALQLNEVIVVSAAKKFAEKQSDDVARMPLKNLENPQVYTVVPKELLKEQLTTDIEKALQSAPGLNTIAASVGSGGIGLSLRMRGFSSGTNAGAVRNGLNTNFSTISDPVNLESIEVIKGPSGTLFGSTMINYGGLINRVTKKPFDFFRGEVSYTTGSWGLSRLTADVNLPLNKSVSMRINTALHSERSFQDYGKTNTYVFAPAFRYTVNDRLTLDLDFELFKTVRNTTYIGSPGSKLKAKNFNELHLDPSFSYTSDEIQSKANVFNAFAKATYKISEHWTSQTAFSYASTENNANYLFLMMTTDTSLTRRLMNIPSNFGVNQIQQNFISDVKWGSIRNRLLVGLDYTQVMSTDRRGVIGAYDVVKINQAPAYISNAAFQQKLAGLTYSNYKRNFQTYSAYASDVINLTENILAMASVRIDRYSSQFENYSQTSVSPKLGVVYQIVKNKVSLFGNYMNGFRNVAPGTVAANPTTTTPFKPEHANQLEGGIKAELLDGKLSGTLSYYDIQVANKVRTDPANPLYSIQDGTQHSTGFEADLIANPVRGLNLILGYGYNKSVYTKAEASVQGKRPYSTPPHAGNFWLSYKVMQGKATGFGAGLGGNFQSNSYLDDANTFTIEGFAKFDATVFYDQPSFRFGLKLNNLTNQHYIVADYWGAFQPPRQFVANLTYKFQ